MAEEGKPKATQKTTQKAERQAKRQAMSGDLDVDTDLIRRASALLGQAGDAMPGRPAVTVPAGISEHAAGASAAGRQALRLATTRVQQGILAAAGLSAVAGTLAERLARVAQLFDEAEALARAGG